MDKTIDPLQYEMIRKYGYLFPYRDDIPIIKEHLFSNLHGIDMPINKYVVSKMLDIDYIGWTTKAILNINLFPFQMVILRKLWNTPFPMLIASRGGSKSYILATYAILKALLEPGTKIVIVGAGLRQAKLVFSYIESIWSSAPVLRNIVGGGKNAGPRQSVDQCYFRVGSSIITGLPIGTGEKIRGFRANIVIADEFASLQEDIFDIVIRGFAATTKTPMDEAKRLAFKKKVEKLDIEDDVKEKIIGGIQISRGNQIVYSGTAYYAFNHFAKRFETWKSIIRSRGDQQLTADIFGGLYNIPKNFNYKDYAIIRIPYNYLPEGLLDPRQLANAKATLPTNIFNMEYSACFVKDSDGYFKRSLIESCTVGPNRAIQTIDGDVTFTPLMTGIKGRKYVVGIDPAAEHDNLSVCVLEVWPNHTRIVYSWSINKPEFKRRKKIFDIESDDYYDYCCNKIRQIATKFRPIRILMDSQGGGYSISEMLRNPKLIDKSKDEFPIYEIINPKEPKFFDLKSDGPHILELINQSSEYNSKANAYLHKSMETRSLLFPAFDVVKMQSALALEKSMNISIDTFEECTNNIEEMKNELCTIKRTETLTGKERFDTSTTSASINTEGRSIKGKLRKDRYTSLLLSHNYVYEHEFKIKEDVLDYENIPGNFQKIEKVDPLGGMYTGLGMVGMQNAEFYTKGHSTPFGAIKRNEKI